MSSLLLTGAGPGRAGGGGGGGAAPPLDGLANITAAYSASRELITGFGSTFYSLTGSNLNQLFDQSGNGRTLGGSASNTITVVSAGPNSKDAFDMPAGGNFIGASIAISNFIANNDGYVVASFISDAHATNNANTYQNHAVWADSGGFAGVFIKNNATGMAYNWDGSDDHADASVAQSTAYVVEWIHTGGNVSIRVNAGTPASSASGNTSDLTGNIRMAIGSGTSQGFDGKFFEFVFFNVTPNSTIRDALAADMMDWIGAV